MAATAKKTETTIEIPRLEVEMLEVTIVGDSPLIVHAWSAKAKREMLQKQMKKAKAAKEAKDPRKDFEESLYRFEDGGYGFPSVGFKAAAATAALTTDGIKKAHALRAFHVIGEDIDVNGAFDGTVMRQNLVRIEGAPPRMREDLVRVGMGTADLRYRAEFPTWFARILVRHQPRLLSAEQILNLINLAGFSVGVGEWRPEKGGSSGMFHVASSGEIEAILAGLEPQRRAA
ncbi:hypothetical protein [Hansschlegelia sp.]|uniref:hypothetical protein n=1 Tax=Hansschlegelia sp. TaxID=2041892 RepID=UPI002C3BB7F7|nr:hypothetical protein [Hansschlegelia sp.]HVI28860.1 hypothetical protein [Hansschlegelia sp.]